MNTNMLGAHEANQKALIVGLTGGIATGKTTVACVFGKLGAQVICCDEIAHRALWKNTKTYKKIVAEFGLAILDKRKRVDKKRLADIIFKSKHKRGVLEEIIHPFVFEKLFLYVKKARGILIIDVPLLFETGFEKYVDVTILVACSKRTQKKRLTKRDVLSVKEVESRLKAQMPLDKKRKKADWVIENEDLKKTMTQIRYIWNQVVKAYKTKKTIETI